MERSSRPPPRALAVPKSSLLTDPVTVGLRSSQGASTDQAIASPHSLLQPFPTTPGMTGASHLPGFFCLKTHSWLALPFLPGELQTSVVLWGSEEKRGAFILGIASFRPPERATCPHPAGKRTSSGLLLPTAEGSGHADPCLSDTSSLQT